MVVVGFGEPLLAGEAERFVERSLGDAGVLLVDEKAIPEVAQALDNGAGPADLAQAFSGRIHYLVTVRAEFVGERQLQYMGRYETALQSRLQVRTLDLVSRRAGRRRLRRDRSSTPRSPSPGWSRPSCGPGCDSCGPGWRSAERHEPDRTLRAGAKPGTLSAMVEGVRGRRVVVVDDSPLQCAAWRRLLEERYGDRVRIESYTSPLEAATHLSPDIHLLLVDWEMPEMDGKELVEVARQAGVNLKRVIISSAHPADLLHQEFDQTGCLAVIEKAEPEQQAAFLMILDSIMRR